jgi:large subunit ribosomal protein L28
MSRICEVSGKRPVVANKIVRRGKAKREGGVGRKTTGITKRRQYPNLRKLRLELGGKTIVIRVAMSHVDKVYEAAGRLKGVKLDGLSEREIKRRLLSLIR